MDTTAVSAERPRFFRPEYVYPVLLLLWGAALALVIPPNQCPDEASHAFRSFHLSRGRIHPDGIQDGWLCGRAPVALHELFNLMFWRTGFEHPQRCLSREEFEHFSSIRLDTNPELTAGFCYLSYTCFVPYVPQALGIALAREMGGSVLAGFYAGRLANLLFAVLALHLALRLMPFYKNLLGAVALLPVSVQQAASLSADVVGFASCFLFTALALRLLAPAPRRAGLLHLLGLCTLALLMPLCKLPYALLTLLYLAVPASRLGSLRRWLLVGTALAAMIVLGTYITLRSSEGATHMGEGVPTPDVSRGRQAEYLRQHPFRFARIMGRTTATWVWVYCDQITTLGWLNLPLNDVPAKAYLLFLVLLALVDRRPDWAPNLRLRLAALSLCGLAFVAFHLMLYLIWTAVGHHLIEGFQARYLIGYLPVMLLPFYSRVVTVRSNPRAVLALGAAAGTGVQLATLHAITTVYYFGANPKEIRHSFTVTLVGGLLFLGTLLAVVRRSRPADSTNEEATRGDSESVPEAEPEKLPQAA